MVNTEAVNSIESISGLLVFQLNGQAIGVDIKKVICIINPEEEDPASLLIEEKESVIKYKNENFFLIDLYELFGFTKKVLVASKRIVLISNSEISFAVCVDKIKEIVTINKNSRNQLQISLTNSNLFTCGSINYDGEEVWIADLNKIQEHSFTQ